MNGVYLTRKKMEDTEFAWENLDEDQSGRVETPIISQEQSKINI